MPIHPRHRGLYPFDWRQLSVSIRFRRASGRCERCGRPHGREVLQLCDGLWWDEDARAWRCGAEKRHRRLPPPHSVILPMRRTRVFLSTCHLDHDPTNNEAGNLLDGSSGTSASFVSSFTRNASGATSVQTLSIATSGTSGTQVAGAGGILAVAISGTISTSAQGSAGTGSSAGSYAAGSLLAIDITSATASDLKALQTGVDQLISQVTTAATQLGTASSVITNQQSYVTALSDAVTSGVGSLVDADMNVASTRLQALQTQQQLGIQALSIANQNSQLILKLFGG